MVELQTPEPEVGGSKLADSVFCPVIKQDTLLCESTGNTLEAAALSRHYCISTNKRKLYEHDEYSIGIFSVSLPFSVLISSYFNILFLFQDKVN